MRAAGAFDKAERDVTGAAGDIQQFCPGRGASQSIIASFQKRWIPRLIASFMTSYFDATLPNTPRTRPAFSDSGTS